MDTIDEGYQIQNRQALTECAKEKRNLEDSKSEILSCLMEFSLPLDKMYRKTQTLRGIHSGTLPDQHYNMQPRMGYT